MDLYDDLDTKQRPGQIDGWSSGVKLMQTQLQLKRAIVTPPVRKEPPKRASVSLCNNNNSNSDSFFFLVGVLFIDKINQSTLYISWNLKLMRVNSF